MASNTEKAQSELARSVIERWNSIQGYTPDFSLDLFQAFDLTGFAYKGQLTTGYSAYGLKAGADVEVDFGTIIMPDVIGVVAKGGLGGERSKVSMLAVQRHPKTYYGRRKQPTLPGPKQPQGGAQPSPQPPAQANKVLWESDSPVCLLLFKGAVTAADLKLGAAIEAGHKWDDELGLKVSVEVGVNVGGQVLRVYALPPMQYASAADSGLKGRFHDEMMAVSAETLRATVAAWLKEEVGEKDWPPDAVFTGKQALAVAQDTLKKWVEDGFGLTVDEAPVLGKVLEKLRSTEKPEALLTALADLKESLENRLYDEQHPLGDKEKEELRAKIRQIAGFRALMVERTLRKGQQQQPTATDVDKLCLFDVLTLGAGASAGVEGEVKFKLESEKLSSDGEATAGVEVKGDSTRVSYRYQSYAAGKRAARLIFTQDAVLSYRHVNVAAAAKAKLALELSSVPGGPQREFEKEKELELYHYRTLVYRAASLYWFYPTGTQVGRLTPGSGSGVSFGMGVQLPRLLKLLDHPADHHTEEQNKLLARMAAQLRVPQSTLEQFFSQLGGEGGIFYDVDPAQFKVDTLLVESSFAFPDKLEGSSEPTFAVYGSYRKKEKSWRLNALLTDDNVKAFVKQLDATVAGSDPSPQLDALRLRYRLGDEWDRGETLFKLGFGKMIKLFKLKAELAQSKHGAHEGVIDLYTWFAHDLFNQMPADGYELTVPPVALVHQ